MKIYALRLKKGADLKKSIEDLCQKKKLKTAAVLSSVGCLFQYHIRLAKAKDEILKKEDVEILSLNGTISNGKAHLHICLSDDKGKCIGGHLLEGCLIETTCELMLIESDILSKRVYDENTTYAEIVFEKED